MTRPVFVDTACTFCGERIIEVEASAAFDALAAHDCLERQAFCTTTDDIVRSWKRVTN